VAQDLLTADGLLNHFAFYALGCSRSELHVSGAIVLDFGQPWFSWYFAEQGTIPFHPNFTFNSIDAIEYASKQFLRGFWECHPPVPYANPDVDLLIGTNNYAGSGGNVTYQHGAAWANLVDNVNSWINSSGYASRERADGAIDIEFPWSPAGQALAWADGYDDAGSYRYYNYGTCEGCPSQVHPSWAYNNNGYTLNNIYQLSYGYVSAYPLPEIYLTSGENAWQWQEVKLRHYNATGERAPIYAGAMTQWNACLEIPPACTPGVDDNSPANGWGQLWLALASNPNTGQDLDWSTDIAWGK
jgi:hypothetical protein